MCVNTGVGAERGRWRVHRDGRCSRGDVTVSETMLGLGLAMARTLPLTHTDAHTQARHRQGTMMFLFVIFIVKQAIRPISL